MGQIGKILYSKVARPAKPNDKSSEKKVFALQQSRQTVNLDDIARHMTEHNSPFTKGTVKGILDDFVDHIVEMLLDSRRVHLDGLGTIFTTLSSDGADSADDFTAASIKRVNPRMSFDKEMRANINNNAEFELTSSRELQAQARKEQAQNVDGAIGATGTGGTGDSGTGGNNGGQADPGDVTP